jgi:hypothetical protein
MNRNDIRLDSIRTLGACAAVLLGIAVGSLGYWAQPLAASGIAAQLQAERSNERKRAAETKAKIQAIQPNLSPLSLLPRHQPRVTFQNGIHCYYRSPFFDKDVRAVESLPQLATFLSPRITRSGAYMVGFPQSTAPSGQTQLTIDCDGVATNFSVDPTMDPTQDIQLPFNATTVSLKALVGRVAVAGAPPGSTVKLVATPSPAVSGLSFLWAANEGRVASLNGPVTEWNLPQAPGLHFAYVTIRDSNGAYAEASVAVATDRRTIVPAPAPLPPTPLPSDKAVNLDHFLTFFSTKSIDVYDNQGADTRMGSCQYYLAIDAVGGCTPEGLLVDRKIDFEGWLRKWGFDRPGNHEAKARYQNLADLNLQRDMHGLANANGTAFYVCNYPGDKPGQVTLTNVLRHRNLVACVAMEYSPGPGGGAPFTKFLTFGPGGELFQSVNLDGRGEKFMPGSCVVCHGASIDYGHYAENGTSNPNLSAQFLPFDLQNFEFVNRPGLRRSDQEPELLKLNKLVLGINPNPAIRDVINGGYNNFASSTFVDNVVPSGWDITMPIPGANNGLTPRALYLGVIRPSCRTCHTSMSPGDGLDFRDFASFDNNWSFEAGARVCGPVFASINGKIDGNSSAGVTRKNYSMPNSKVTFDRFWNNVPPPPSPITRTQSQLMEDYAVTNKSTGVGSTCQPPD